jgi:hypothetical protein
MTRVLAPDHVKRQFAAGARGMLPWFYWTSTRLMFRPPTRTRGTVDIVLDEPGVAETCLASWHLM